LYTTGRGEHHGRQVSEVEREIEKAGRGGQESEESRNRGKSQSISCQRREEDQVGFSGGEGHLGWTRVRRAAFDEQGTYAVGEFVHVKRLHHMPLVSGNSSRKLWPKFAGIRFLVLTSLDGKDRGNASEHCIIAPSAGDIGTHGPARQLSAAIKPQRMTSTLIATTSIPGIRLQSIRVKTHSQVSKGGALS